MEIKKIITPTEAPKANKYMMLGIAGACALVMMPEIVCAAKFDIDAGIKAATDPLIKAISDHWGKFVLLTGTTGAVVGDGDARQRVVRAGITAAAAGGVIMALLSMLS